jgi:hypothetical protein
MIYLLESIENYLLLLDKQLIFAEFMGLKATIVLNINPLPIKDTNEFSWSYQIEGSNYNNTGGAYQNSEDQLLLAMYKGLYKGLRAIVDNNLNRKNIEVICKKQNILKLTTNVSQENLSRIKNIEAYIENNGLIIKYR